jgi:hypothetical protein
MPRSGPRAGRTVRPSRCFRNPTASDLMLIRGDGRVKLVYKPAFFTSVYDKYGDGGVLAIMAHEVGHAIDGTTPLRG